MRSRIKTNITAMVIAALLGCLAFAFQVLASDQTSLYDLTWSAEQSETTLQIYEAVTGKNGIVYDKALGGTSMNVDNYGDYKLNREYDVFAGTIVCNANPALPLADPNRTDIRVFVYGDGVLLYCSESVNLDGNEIQEFRIGVSGVDTLRIVINGMNYIRLCNAVLEKHQETTVQEVSLYDMTWSAEQPEMTLKLSEAATDIYGNAYGRALTGTASNVDNYGDYVLNGEYDIFAGTVIRNAGTNPAVDLRDPNRTDICVSVYGDGVLLYRSQSANLEGNEIQEFSVNVSGVNTLRVAVNGMKYLSVCNAVLEKYGDLQMPDTGNIIWSGVNQEYQGLTYTTMNIGAGGDEKYYQGKALLGFAFGTEFICYGDRIYYMEPQDEFTDVTSLYSAKLDGTDVVLIDEYCMWPSDMVMAEGKLYYVRFNKIPLVAEVICYDPQTKSEVKICNGRLFGSGYGALYVWGSEGVKKIDPGTNHVIQISADPVQPYQAGKEIVLKLPFSDGAGRLTYPVYDMQTGVTRQVSVPDEYAGGLYPTAPGTIAGEYFFVYGNGEVLQYTVTDGTLMNRFASDNDNAFWFGQTLKYEQQYAAIFNEESWSIFSEELNGWVMPVYTADVKQAIYEKIQAQFSAVEEFGMTMPGSADELIIRNHYVMCGLEDFVYIACETDPYRRNEVYNPQSEYQNVWIVKVRGDRSCEVVGSEYWQ